MSFTEKGAAIYEGRPCKAGHTRRYVANGKCCACQLARQRTYKRESKPPMVVPVLKPSGPNLAPAFPISRKQLLTGRP